MECLKLAARRTGYNDHRKSLQGKKTSPSCSTINSDLIEKANSLAVRACVVDYNNPRRWIVAPSHRLGSSAENSSDRIGRCAAA